MIVSFTSKLMVVVVLAVSAGFAPPLWAQDKPANHLERVHQELKAGKKSIVAKYMDLSDSQAEKFWPVYEAYQTDLGKLDARLLDILESYSADHRNNALTDEKAKVLLDRWIALEQDEARHRRSYVPKILQALPPKKAARYLQIENEYRILMRYDLAVNVPLAG